MSPLLPVLIYRHTHLDANGVYVPSVGYRLYSFESGTTTPLATLNESGTSNTNPTVLNANGEAHIRLSDSSYTFCLTDDAGSPSVGPTGEGTIQDGYPIDNVISDFAAAKLLINALDPVPVAGTTDPKAPGVPAPGTSGTWSDADHVHPASFPSAGLTGYNNTSGAEMIVSSGDREFTSPTNWSGTNWAFGTGAAVKTAGAANILSLASAGLSTAIEVGKTYKVTATIITTTVGAISISLGGVTISANGDTLGTQTAFSAIFTATTTDSLSFTPSAAWAGSIDSVSVKPCVIDVTPLVIKFVDGCLAVFA